MSARKLKDRITFRICSKEKNSLLQNSESLFMAGKIIRCMIHKFNNDVQFREDVLYEVKSLKVNKEKKPINIDLLREYNRKRQIKYRNLNPLNKLKSSVRNRVYLGLSAKNVYKKEKTQMYLGCSFEFYKNYLEKNFKKGMSWENRSKWHIDHIIPLSSATTEEELIKLFHYTNTQPLWAKDNLSKGARYDNTTEN